MGIKNIMEAGSRAVHTAGLKVKKNSPTILLVCGVVGLGVAAHEIRKAARKEDAVAEDISSRIEAVHEKQGVIPEKEYKAELTGEYAKAVLAYTKLYGPAVVIGGFSITSILVSHKILRDRNTALAMAYTGLKEAYDRYVERVENLSKTEKFAGVGDVAKGIDRNVAVDEDGSSLDYIDTDSFSSVNPYVRVFSPEYTQEADRDIIYNEQYLRAKQSGYTLDLRTRGHIFVNDILNELGYDAIPSGQWMGWSYQRGVDDHVPVIDMRIQKVMVDDGDGKLKETMVIDLSSARNILDDWARMNK